MTRANIASDGNTPVLPQPLTSRPGFLHRIFGAAIRARQRRDELQLGRFLKASGGRLTDDLERRLTRETIQNFWF